MKKLLFGLYLLLSSGQVFAGLGVGDVAKCVDLQIREPGQENLTTCVITPQGETKFTLLDFSSTTCPACIQNFPVFHEFVSAHPELTERTVLIDRDAKAIDLWLADQTPFSETKPPIKHGDLTVAYDNNREATNQFKFKYIPTMYLLDKDGKIVWLHVGVLGSSDKKAILSLIGSSN